jgi:hypothetical protein
MKKISNYNKSLRKMDGKTDLTADQSQEITRILEKNTISHKNRFEKLKPLILLNADDEFRDTYDKY